MNSLVMPLAGLIVLLVYFIPSMLAYSRGHINALPIALTNLLFGWTIIGWGIALVWSVTRQAGGVVAAGASAAPAGKAPKFAKLLSVVAVTLGVLMIAVVMIYKHHGKETPAATQQSTPTVKTGVPVPAEELFGK